MIQKSFLWPAISTGNANEVKRLLKDNQLSIFNGTLALVEASFCGRVDILELLISSNCTVEFAFETMSTKATSKGHLQVLQYMIKNAYDISARCLFLALKYRHRHIIKFLLDRGVSELSLAVIVNEPFEYKELLAELQEFGYNLRDKDYLSSEQLEAVEKVFNHRKLAATKIQRWWLPICHRLVNEKGEPRMAVKSWEKYKRHILSSGEEVVFF